MSGGAADAIAMALRAMTNPPNRAIAAQMETMARTLEAQRASLARVRAFRRAAAALGALPDPVATLAREGGVAGLRRSAGLPEDAARAVTEIVTTRRWVELERLTGAPAPEALFRRLPGVGPRLAARLAASLHVDTLAGLEAAARDGRLASLREVGPRRAEALRAALAAMEIETGPPPPVALLLATDRAYRDGAAAGTLPWITPLRQTAPRVPRAPVLHLRQGDWNVTAMHPLVRHGPATAAAPDEVMLHARLREGPESQWCVATRPGGPAGWRVVVGREADCPPPPGTDDA